MSHYCLSNKVSLGYIRCMTVFKLRQIRVMHYRILCESFAIVVHYDGYFFYLRFSLGRSPYLKVFFLSGRFTVINSPWHTYATELVVRFLVWLRGRNICYTHSTDITVSISLDLSNLTNYFLRYYILKVSTWPNLKFPFQWHFSV